MGEFDSFLPEDQFQRPLSEPTNKLLTEYGESMWRVIVPGSHIWAPENKIKKLDLPKLFTHFTSMFK